MQRENRRALLVELGSAAVVVPACVGSGMGTMPSELRTWKVMSTSTSATSPAFPGWAPLTG